MLVGYLFVGLAAAAFGLAQLGPFWGAIFAPLIASATVAAAALIRSSR
jgi:hypothetical protein